LFIAVVATPVNMNLFLQSNWHVVAEWLFSHIVTIDRISPGPAASADINKLAFPTLPFIRLEIT